MAEGVDIEKLFFEENFAINKFLSKSTQKSDLETLRSQLKEYGTSLHNSMTEIFKTETESIVDLAENLTNLDSKINNLIQPASQLREEILTLYNTIKSNRETYDRNLENLERNRRDRHILSLKQKLLESKNDIEIMLSNQTNVNPVNLLDFERVVNNYALHLSFAIQLPFEDETLLNVEPRLLQNINDEYLKALKDKNVDIACRCLRMIVNLGQERPTEKIYREKILCPKLRVIFTQRHLEAQGGDLKKLYDHALRVLDEDMSFLMNLINENRDLRSFQFVRNSFWLEVDNQMMNGLGDVTVPGNPSLFQSRFCATWDFLCAIVSRCEIENPNDHLELNDRISCHVQRFNLPVYFEIRYQQISSTFETAFVRTTNLPNNIGDIYSSDNSKLVERHTLYITGVFLDCVKLCFSADVLIPQLIGQFVKLSMLLLTRYLSWFPTFLTQFKTIDSSNHQMALVYILNDLTLVKNIFGCVDPKLSIYSICAKDLGNILEELAHSNNDTIEETIKKTIRFIVDLKTDEVLASLQNVNAIPRLYRKTNRNRPTSPSGYIIDAIGVLDTFQRNYSKQTENVADSIINNVTKRFLLLVSDVLSSVSKTEESLKRLKRQTGNTSSETTQDASSDNYKIREQIRLDVGHFVDKFIPSCSKTTEMELARLAKSAGYVLPEID